MDVLNFDEMMIIEGGSIDCRTAGHGATILGAAGVAVTAVTILAKGPVGVAHALSRLLGIFDLVM